MDRTRATRRSMCQKWDGPDGKIQRPIFEDGHYLLLFNTVSVI